MTSTLRLRARPVTLCAASLFVAGAGLLSSKAQGQEWQRLGPGISYRGTILRPGIGMRDVQVTVARVGFDSAQLRIVDVYGTLRSRGGSFTYSLTEISRFEPALVLMNGGSSSSFSLPLPAGLLVRDGRVVSRLSVRDRLLDGVLCVGAREVKILSRDQYAQATCRAALQAGPLLVMGGKIIVGDSVPGIARQAVRSAVGVDETGKVYLVVASRSTLHDLARFLMQELKCSAALNMAGSTDAGLLLRRGDQWMTVGTVDSPIASAIVVGPR